MTKDHETFEIEFTAYWDRDECGAFPEAEVVDYPDFLSRETVRAIERDIRESMKVAARARKAGVV